MKYYINEIHSPFISYNQLIVGLFKSTDGGLTYTGGQCEVNYVEDCTVLAYYIQNRHPGYEPKGYPHIRERVIYEYFDKLEIGSPMWTESFEADNDSTAIDKFFQEQFDTRFKARSHEMTIEEAIECNKNLKMYMEISDKNNPHKFLEENYIALDMAIKALEQTREEANKLKEDIKSIRDNPLFNMVSKDTILEIVLEKIDMFAESEDDANGICSL